MNIRNGDSGDKVKVIQGALIAQGFNLADGADGIFGSETEEAVRTFQKQQGLDDDGIVGKETLQALHLDPDTLQPVSGGDTATDSNVEVTTATTPVSVWPTHPLPPSESARFVTALANLENKVAASDDPRKWRYQCWFEKLKTSDVDDRVIQWGAICPSTSGAIGAAFVVGPCDIERSMGPTQEEIEKAIRSVEDVDAVGQSLGILTYLKADIVVSEEMTALPLENLQMMHDDVQRAIDKLGKWSDAPLGGSSAMPPAYVAIKDWIASRQDDSNSLYSCL
jgi:Putative peptidoglycan binding domain